MQADAKWLEESYKKVANERYDINCAIKAMPAGLSESFFNFENVEGMIDKCVEKLKNILDRWRCYLVKEDLKELQDVIDYQVKIKQHIKLGLDSQGSPGKNMMWLHQIGIFAVRGEVLLRAILTLLIYLLLNFRNLPRALSKLSSQDVVLFYL